MISKSLPETMKIQQTHGKCDQGSDKWNLKNSHVWDKVVENPIEIRK